MKTASTEFFREFTLRICSSLDIQQALMSTFEYFADGRHDHVSCGCGEAIPASVARVEREGHLSLPDLEGAMPLDDDNRALSADIEQIGGLIRSPRHEHEPLLNCPTCGCTDLRDRREHQNWQIDLPEIISDITRFVTEKRLVPLLRTTCAEQTPRTQPSGRTRPPARRSHLNKSCHRPGHTAHTATAPLLPEPCTAAPSCYLHQEPGQLTPLHSWPVPTGQETATTMDEAISDHIRTTLEHTRGKVSGPGGAAELLGMNASTLRFRMNKLNVRLARQLVP